MSTGANDIDIAINTPIPAPHPGVISNLVSCNVSGFKLPRNFTCVLLYWSDSSGYHEKLYMSAPGWSGPPTPSSNVTVVISYPSGPITTHGGIYRNGDGTITYVETIQ